jgi:hypothetical protein
MSARAQGNALLLAAAAALIVMLGLFGDWARVLSLVLIGGVATATAPLRHTRGAGWWTLLGLGAAAAIGGALLAQAAETLGGLIALVGSILVVIAAAMGYPGRG